MMPMRTYWFTSRAATKRAIANTPIRRMYCDSPSRKNANKKARNTNAEPVSCCSRMSPAGTAVINSSVTLVRSKVRSRSMALIYLASTSAVENLANSEGCSLKAPKSIHDCPPLVTVPINSVAISRRSTMPYMM